MKKSFVLFLLLFSGCASVNVEKTTNKIENSKVVQTETTKGKAVFFLSKGEASKISLGKETKTSSQLFGAAQLSESSDTESINALKSLFGDLLIKALTAGK